MARCNCGEGCGCVAGSSDGSVTIGGTGSTGNPWDFTVTTNCTQVRGCLSEGPGIDFDPVTGVISADLSTDAGNNIMIGTDGGLLVPAGVAAVTGCGMDGVGTMADPLVAKVVPWDFPCDQTLRQTNIYCDPVTGNLVGPPRGRTFTGFTMVERTYPDLQVPSGIVLVTMDTFNFSRTNPNLCRTMKLIVWANVEVEYDLAVGTRAGFGIAFDRLFGTQNTGTVKADDNNIQMYRKIIDIDVLPGATFNYTVDVRGERGTAGATYNRIQVQVDSMFFEN